MIAGRERAASARRRATKPKPEVKVTAATPSAQVGVIQPCVGTSVSLPPERLVPGMWVGPIPRLTMLVAFRYGTGRQQDSNSPIGLWS